MTPYGVQIQQIPVEIDEELLRQIADITGGEYFRATDNTKLMSIYSQINQMEKAGPWWIHFPYTGIVHDFCPVSPFALALEFLLRWIVLRRIP